ncbi:uncharacterized protein BKA78DRAFT_316293 [Phyllosticta capitalensis]|uniref:uncharacterized protein n=1 Tax=Phyllosticta capitalensis TaxID=121624 RepID=UPI00312F3931
MQPGRLVISHDRPQLPLGIRNLRLALASVDTTPGIYSQIHTSISKEICLKSPSATIALTHAEKNCPSSRPERQRGLLFSSIMGSRVALLTNSMLHHLACTESLVPAMAAPRAAGWSLTIQSAYFQISLHRNLLFADSSAYWLLSQYPLSCAFLIGKSATLIHDPDFASS